MIKIREFRDSDSRAVLDILMACFGEETKYMFRGKLGLAREVYGAYYQSASGKQYLKNCIIAEADKRVVGVIGMQVPGKKGEEASSYSLWRLIRKAGFKGIFIKLALRVEEGGERPEGAIYLDFLGILPEYSNRGMGTRLMKTAEKKAGELGISHMALDVWSHNKEALGLYKKLGYEITKSVSSRVVRLFLGSREYYVMEKRLS
jgi:ribosomal protein S18 acetylase RimI-like enzyme